MSHTPGPWMMRTTYTHGEPAGYAIEPSILMHDESPLSDETIANATLIAAAPLMKGQLETGIEAMREALRQAAACDYDQVHAILSGIIAGNELAISKAEGKG